MELRPTQIVCFGAPVITAHKKHGSLGPAVTSFKFQFPGPVTPSFWNPGSGTKVELILPGIQVSTWVRKPTWNAGSKLGSTLGRNLFQFRLSLGLEPMFEFQRNPSSKTGSNTNLEYWFNNVKTKISIDVMSHLSRLQHP